jgi:hypothetical protein
MDVHGQVTLAWSAIDMQQRAIQICLDQLKAILEDNVQSPGDKATALAQVNLGGIFLNSVTTLRNTVLGMYNIPPQPQAQAFESAPTAVVESVEVKEEENSVVEPDFSANYTNAEVAELKKGGSGFGYFSGDEQETDVVHMDAVYKYITVQGGDQTSIIAEEVQEYKVISVDENEDDEKEEPQATKELQQFENPYLASFQIESSSSIREDFPEYGQGSFNYPEWKPCSQQYGVTTQELESKVVVKMNHSEVGSVGSTFMDVLITGGSCYFEVDVFSTVFGDMFAIGYSGDNR